MILQDGQVIDDRYEVKSMVGQGGMSFVYRAFDRKMGRMVALKALKEEYCGDEEFIRKFQNEAQAAAKLNHKNIVAPYDVVDDEKEKLHYIVMELVEGITLKEYIKRKGALSDRETIGIALQVVDGMEQAHKMGIVHRDIKPQNIIISESGIVKIADFGIARAASQQTIDATVMGSVYYISPEQARSGLSDERSDIYSFGCTMYEMLTGRVPFEGNTSVMVVFAHMESPVPHASDLEPTVCTALDLCVYKCMQKRPANRYQHIEELGEDLRMALDDPDGSFMEDDEALSELESGEDGFLDEDPEEEEGFQEGFLAQKQPVEPSTPSNEFDSDMSNIYRYISIACIALIIGLLFFIGFRVFLFMTSGPAVETMTPTSESTEEESVQASITISAIETRLADIIGKTVDEAMGLLSEYNLKLHIADEQFSDTYNEGLIIDYKGSDNPEGDLYRPGDTVDVTISKGQLTISFYNESDPDSMESLHAVSFQDLKKRLDERGVKYREVREHSDVVPEGNIIRTNKASTAEEGDPLEIVVSEGVAVSLSRVPEIVGHTEEEAMRLLLGAELLPGMVNSVPDEHTEKGMVLQQEVSPGTLLSRGTYVNFTISSGSEGDASVHMAALNAEDPTIEEIEELEDPGSVTEGEDGSEEGGEGGDEIGPGNDTEEHWYGSINQTVTLGIGGPGVSETMLISVRLRQDVDGESRYTTLQSARTYEMGTELQVVFSRIEGISGVPYGTVEVVDAADDVVIAEFSCGFEPG